MTQRVALKDFYHLIMAEVIEQSHGQPGDDTSQASPADFKENVFTQLFMDDLVDLGVIEDGRICYLERRTGAGHIKVNGYHFDDEEGLLVLFTSIYNDDEDISGLTLTEVKQALNRAERFFKWAMRDRHRDMEPACEQYDMVKLICDSRNQINQVKIFLFTNAEVSETLYTVTPKEEDGITFRYYVWDITRLYRARASGLPFEPIEVSFENHLGKPLDCLRVEEASEDYSAYLAVIPGDILYQLYDEYGSRLLELNVRSFLQAKGKINRGIRDTLRSQPERFLAYNNGISITVNHLELVQTTGGNLAIKGARGFQIVNGGQTMASIHRARKVDRVDLSKVYLQAKITMVTPEKVSDIIPKITLYANSQNPVKDADFSSNDPYHVELQRLSEIIWTPGEQSRWFYERARGQYQAEKARQATTSAQKKHFEAKSPSKQSFTKTDLAKYINACDGLPHVVGKGSQKNFVEFMQRVRIKHGNEWKPDRTYYQDLIGKVILYKAAETIVRELKIPAYRANVVAYSVAYLIHRTYGRMDYQKIWNQQRVSLGTQEAFRSFMPVITEEIVSSAGDRNVTEWCKKEGCWEVIRKISLDLPEVLKSEIGEELPLPNVGHRTISSIDDLSDQDRDNIAKVIAVDGLTWFRIAKWGTETGALNQWQCGIAHTLSGYAASDWNRVPSPKQAKHGSGILDIAFSDQSFAKLSRDPE